MKMLLLCLGLILVCAHGEENTDAVTSKFDISKISGEWYSILLASDVKKKIEENGSMRVFVEHIHVLNNSSLSFKYRAKVNGQCTEFSLVANKTEEDGVYSGVYDGFNVFSISELVSPDHIIVYLVNFNNGETFQLLEFYAREPDVSPELKEKFEKISQKHGIVEGNIVDLTKADRCLQARESGVSQASSAE